MFIATQAAGFGVNTLLTRLTFFNSAGSTASTITIPASSPNRSVAVLFDNAWTTSSSPDPVNPNSNWTGPLYTAQFSSHTGTAWWRILDADDEGDSITGMNGDSSNDKVMVVFQGDVDIWRGATGDVESEGTIGNPAAQTVSALGVNTPVIVLGMAGAVGATAAFSTASPAFDGTALNSDSDIIAGYKIYNSTAADHSIDMNDLSQNFLASFYLIAR